MAHAYLAAAVKVFLELPIPCLQSLTGYIVKTLSKKTILQFVKKQISNILRQDLQLVSNVVFTHFENMSTIVVQLSRFIFLFQFRVSD